MSWDQRFFDPIVLSGRKLLVTLRDAAQYITKLPKAEHDAKEWQAAIRWHMFEEKREAVMAIEAAVLTLAQVRYS